MMTDELKTITTSALDRLSAALDAGHSDQLTAMLRAMARFHRYSLHNVWLIAAQRPTATRVAGFQTWKSLGRFVRRGEKGIAILAPIVRRRADLPEDDQSAVVGFRAAYVFDIAQTDGEPLPQLAETSGDPGAAVERLRNRIIADGIQLSYADSLGGALGVSKGRAIDVLSGQTASTEFFVLTHEYAHELLHRGEDRPTSREVRELEAEAVAFVVAEATGLASLDPARDYIHLYGGNRDALAASLERVQLVAARILVAIDSV